MKFLCDAKVPDAIKVANTLPNTNLGELKDIALKLNLNEQYFCYGSYNFCKTLITKFPKNFSNCWHDDYLFEYSYFSSHLKEFIFNQNQIYMPFCFLENFLPTLKNNVFIRSNKGNKSIPGQVINPKEKNITKILQQTYNVSNDEMVILSDEKEIIQETRFWINNNEIVGMSNYSWNENKFNYIPKESIELAEIISKLHFQIAEKYVLDIVYSNNKSYILEINSFCSSGFYDANVKDIFANIIDK